jgi:acetyl esterase/lipase
MRSLYAAVSIDLEGIDVSRRSIPGGDDDPEIMLQIVRPHGLRTMAPAIFHVHGGGFIMGGPENSHGRMVRLAREVGCVVVQTTYRLAPEHRYPAALRDVVTALRWVGDHASELDIDPGRIAVHGISAGAGLVAAAMLYLRDHGGGPPVCFQFLAIPELDDRLATASMRSFGDTVGWDNTKAAISWESYLGPGVPGSNDVEIYAAPARAGDLSGLPPTYISVMELDPLRDEGIAYANLLLAAGVSVELHLFPGTYHGSSNVLAAPITRREMAEETAVLMAALAIEGGEQGN